MATDKKSQQIDPDKLPSLKNLTNRLRENLRRSERNVNPRKFRK